MTHRNVPGGPPQGFYQSGPFYQSGALPLYMSGRHPLMMSGHFIPDGPATPAKSGLFGTRYWSMHGMEPTKKKKIEEEETIFGKPGHASFSVRLTSLKRCGEHSFTDPFFSFKHLFWPTGQSP